MKLLRNIFFLTIIAGLSFALLAGPSLKVCAADLQFTAFVDRTSLGLNETVTLTIQIQGAGFSGPDPRLPDLSDFRVLSGPNESSTFQFINGRTSSSKTYTLVLQPRREGTLTIGPAELTADGKLYRTDPIALTVGRGAGAPSAPAPSAPAVPAPRVQGNPNDIFVQVSADRSQAYQGEQVILTYTIYTKLSINAYEISKLPSLPGFWVEEFPSPPEGPDVKDVVIGGSHYRAALIRRVALFPTRTGDLQIEPLEVACQVQLLDQRRRSRDPFDILFDSPFMRYRTEERVISTDPLTLKVLPLPEAERPANFNGAVGNFNLDVSLDRQQARTNEALTMTVRYSGSGNIKMLPAPNFRAPADFESYDPKESVQVNKSGNRITGSKVYEYVLIPRFAGRQNIPPIAFSYFDPATKSYQTLTKGGFDINVEQGTSTPVAAAPGISKEDVKLLGQDIHYLKPVGRLKPMAAAYRLPDSYWLGMVLPPVLAALLLGAARMMGVASVQARRQARKAYGHAQRNLRLLAKIAASGPSAGDRFIRFYANAHRTIIAYLGEKLKLPAQGLKEEDVLDQLSQRSIPAAQLDEIRDILNTCNYARFALTSDDASRMDQILRRLRRLIDDLEASWEKMT